MPPAFQLHVETEPAAGRVCLRPLDSAGTLRGTQTVELAAHPVSFWEGLFDTREHVDRYTGNLVLQPEHGPATAASLITRLGRLLAEEVLGPEIFRAVWQGTGHRVLEVRLPRAEGDPLATAFTRVPWEIACSPAGEPLSARNLGVRAVPEAVPAAPLAGVLRVEPDAPFRVLLFLGRRRAPALWRCAGSGRRCATSFSSR